MKRRLWIASLLLAASCTATVATPPPAAPPPAAPPPAEPPPPAGPPPAAPPPAAPPPVAGGPQHPAYLHALSDLRLARALVTKSGKGSAEVKWDEHKVIEMIDNAITSIKHASIDDGKPLDEHPPVDAGMLWGDRLHRALELVESAKRDVEQREDNAAANGLKVRVIQSLDGAVRFLNEGIADAKKRR